VEDNMMNGESKQRRLSDTQISVVLIRRAKGEAPRTIGREFGISGDAVRGLIRRRQTRFEEICADLKVNPETFRKQRTPDAERGSNAVWSPAQVEILTKYFPTRTSIQRMVVLTHHSYYAILHKAAALGLKRPGRKNVTTFFERGGQPLHLSFRCTFKRVLRWLGETGCQVNSGSRAGTYRLDGADNLTPQEVVRIANDHRARREQPLPPFSVRSDAAIHVETERSLTGPSLVTKSDEE
jgi:hypothetical protein